MSTSKPSESTTTSPSEVFVHPETGEIIATREEWLAALTAVEERLAPIFRIRRELRQAFADRYEPVLPPRRSRTETQEKIARCPRCGERIT